MSSYNRASHRTNRPPAIDAAVPKNDMPPLVPLGTSDNVVINVALLAFDKVPSSDAHVSPLQHAKNPRYAHRRKLPVGFVS
mmetsp:Transcript_5301/g.10539  ORF Transcript_5301/g.10539 Transcript_5301/m.10539 type:complete len:81 (-) Transcript_5301:368-610(-)